MFRVISITKENCGSEDKTQYYTVWVKNGDNQKINLVVKSLYYPELEDIELHILGAITILDDDEGKNYLLDIFTEYEDREELFIYNNEELEYALYLSKYFGTKFINKLKKNYDW